MEETRMETVTTESGFTCEIAYDALDDIAVFEDLVKMEDPEVPEPVRFLAQKHVLEMMLGQEQFKNLQQHLKEREGKVKTSSFFRELREIFRGFTESKKK